MLALGQVLDGMALVVSKAHTVLSLRAYSIVREAIKQSYKFQNVKNLSVLGKDTVLKP